MDSTPARVAARRCGAEPAVLFNYNNYKLAARVKGGDCEWIVAGETRSGNVATRPAAGGASRGQRFVHDAADGSGAAAALGAASETAVHLACRPRSGTVAGQCSAHVVVGEYVTGANDHRRQTRRSFCINCNYPFLSTVQIDFNQKIFFEAILIFVVIFRLTPCSEAASIPGKCVELWVSRAPSGQLPAAETSQPFIVYRFFHPQRAG
jgi:hypothetical protein